MNVVYILNFLNIYDITSDYRIAISRLLGGEKQDGFIELPYMGVYEIEKILEEFRDGNEGEFWSDRNGWDIDWWFYLPVRDTVLVVAGSAYNTSMIKLSLDPDAEERQ